MTYNEIEQMFDACEKEYNNYSTGQYCHDASFKWGFQEGAEWMQKMMIDKACECIIKLHNWPTQYEEFAKFQEEFIKAFRKAMEE